MHHAHPVGKSRSIFPLVVTTGGAHVRDLTRGVAGPGRPAGPRWQRSYARRLALTDTVLLLTVTAAAAGLRFGLEIDQETSGRIAIPYFVLGLVLALAWAACLAILGTRDERVVGDGLEEYRRLVNATFVLFGILAIVSELVQSDLSRGYLAIAFPGGLLALVLNRKLWRVWLRGQRRSGNAQTHVLLVGGLSSAREVITRLTRSRDSGMTAVGVWVPDCSSGGASELEVSPSESVVVFPGDAGIDAVLGASQPSLVVVTDSEHLGHRGLRELAWRLGSSDIDLMIAPNVVDVATGRLHLTQLATMSMLHVDEPRYAAAAEWPKLLFDRLLAIALIAVLAPVLFTTAVAVKLSSRGPVLYRQERIGLDRQPFQMLKFRSMREDADAELEQLLAAEGQSAGPLAKLKHDPRITRVGRFIRRFSIDELPQLLNVLKGDMSLVGPRPQRQFEVDLYDEVAHRRLRVRPGVTGLWQVSGRSDLSWDDAVRLDTYYVANWSMTADLIILWKTFRAVIASDGAY